MMCGSLFFAFGYENHPTSSSGLSTSVPDNKSDENLEKIKTASWRKTGIAEGITWKSHHFDDLFSSKQYINVLDIDLSQAQLLIDIPYVTNGFLKTSDAATNTGAIAAINGSYFNTSTGGSTVFFKKNGDIINYTNSGFTSYRENAGFAISSDGKPEVIQRPEMGWPAANFPTVLASGPLLLFNNNILTQVHQPFNTNRHPRTAVGITEDNRLIAVVVDGRNSQSSGMSIEELSIVMKALGCVNAMNLDGGGSSTMWVKKQGVANHPSDNSLFDHNGERGVATVISFI